MAAFEKALAAHQLKPHAVGKVPDFRSKDVAAAVEIVVDAKPEAVLV